MTDSKFSLLLCTRLFLLLVCCWLTATTVQAQNLRAATASSYVERGNQWFAKGEYARAEADFTAYIALNPQHADAYATRGIVRLRQGRADEAQQDFEQCLKLNPNLRQAVEEMIEEAKQQMARRRSPR